MKLFLPYIDPLDGTQLILQKLAVLYGPNGSLRGGGVASAEVLTLISRGAETGRISLDGYEVELTRRPQSAVFVSIIKTSEVLYRREVSGIFVTGLDEQPSVGVPLRHPQEMWLL